MPTRSDIIAAARGWLGTPYRHQASCRGVGSDCLGLIRGIWREVYGTEPERPPAYGASWTDTSSAEILADAARRHLIEIPCTEFRSGDLLLMDLAGQVRKTVHRPHRFPTPADLVNFVQDGMAELTADLKPRQKQRIAGLGIAAPFELWNWQEEAGAPHEVMEAWRGFDLAAEIARLCSWPVTFCNDATAACAAELLFGKGREYRDFAYFYCGYFIGGGVVINGSLHQGYSGNAGALGSFPVPGKGGGAQQLIHTASFYVLEQELKRHGRNPDLLWQNADDWSGAGPALDHWLAQAAEGLAIACAGVAAVLENSAVVIDGAMPAEVRARLTSAVRAAAARVNLQGITPFTIYEGAIGAGARAMGAASLPLFANFIIDREVLFKESV